MSRRLTGLNPDINVVMGSDHAVGNFFQVQDERYTKSGKDEQGEGYVVDWDSLFGFSVNLIGITEDDFGDRPKIIELCNKEHEKGWTSPNQPTKKEGT
jgi:hypothetical protein